MRPGNTIDFRGKSAVIVCHDSVYGPPHELRDYLLRHGVSDLLFIGHRNRYVHDNPVTSSYWEYYTHSHLIRTQAFQKIHLPEYIGYVLDAYLSLVWSFRIRKRIDFFIGAGNLNAFIGLMLQKAGKADKTIYYVIDYLPVRFANRIVNGMYHVIDRVCAQMCSGTWNYSPVMVSMRNRNWRTKFPHQLVVPNGVRLTTSGRARVSSHTIVYIGVLEKAQGIELMIEAMAELTKFYPSIYFTIIGKGSYRKTLENLVERKELSEHIRFEGFVPDHNAADRIIKKSQLGVALYAMDHPYIANTEPGKVKRYLACGLPVLMTDTSGIAQDLVAYKCGFVCRHTKSSVVSSIRRIFDRPARLREYRKNALSFAGRYTWDRVFSEAFRISSVI
jgi:glycosyltransferase involved in cell wall biosynthesis